MTALIAVVELMFAVWGAVKTLEAAAHLIAHYDQLGWVEYTDLMWSFAVGVMLFLVGSGLFVAELVYAMKWIR